LIEPLPICFTQIRPALDSTLFVGPYGEDAMDTHCQLRKYLARP
jgi:hypothetical protein